MSCVTRLWARALLALQQQMDAAEHRYTLQLQAAMEGQRRALRAILFEGTQLGALPAPSVLEQVQGHKSVQHATIPLAAAGAAHHLTASSPHKRTVPEGGVGVRKRARK